jgi:metallo-beta-lactamase family protein
MNRSGSRNPAILRFLGAAGTVTGSRFLLTTGGQKVLVDCGLFQGLKELRLRNWDPFPVEPKRLDAVVITHAHLDHSGYLPSIVRYGYRGSIFATKSTVDLCRILLPDSGRLQEEEAEYANRAGYSKHSPALPLYTEQDAVQAQGYFAPVRFDARTEVANGVHATFRSAGHILGAASILVETPSRRILFSGDLGRPNHPLLRPPAPLPEAEIVAVESTYGDRVHEDQKSLEAFTGAVVRTAERGGVIVIPSFAVDRTEVILFHLRTMVQAGRIPELPIYVDSPMALSALKLYTDAIAVGDAEIRPEMAGHAEVLDPGLTSEITTREESIALNQLDGPIIIISASGMATGGRVLHHLARRLPDSRNSVILVGYQAEGTRGRLLLEGASTVKLLGRYVPVRAEVVSVPAFSVHADREEILKWLATAPRPPELVFIVHGDPAAAQSLRGAVRKELGWDAIVPRHLEQVRID